MAGELHEFCAVAGATGEQNVTPYVQMMLFAMQHRGTEASGIVGFDESKGLVAHREPGLVKDVYTEEVMDRLRANTAIGHNRYSTSGSKSGHPSPVKDGAVGAALSVNGNLPQTQLLEDFLENSNIHTNPMNDVELAGHAFARSLSSGKELAGATREVYPLMQGAFSCVAMHQETIAGFRDRHGIRPLSMARFAGGTAFASESSALKMVDPIEVIEVDPGQLVIARGEQIQCIQLETPDPKLDIFEIVYFSRPDTRLYGQTVGRIRRSFGRQLAEQHRSSLEKLPNPIIVPVPATSIHVAEGVSEALRIPHRQSIVKNQYMGRTFIAPAEEERASMIEHKHDLIEDDFVGKDVILVDDSIVRAATMKSVIRKIKEAGASSVSVLVSSPPVRYPDFYGIDTPDQDELVAANHTIDEIKHIIGADFLGYLHINRLIEATGVPKERLNLSCFNGVYPVDIGEENRSKIRSPKSLEMVE